MLSYRHPAATAPASLVGAQRRTTLAVALAPCVAALLVLAPSVLAQVSFSGPANLAAGDGPRSVAVGDF